VSLHLTGLGGVGGDCSLFFGLALYIRMISDKELHIGSNVNASFTKICIIKAQLVLHAIILPKHCNLSTRCYQTFDRKGTEKHAED